jgi:hypothetical protein
VIGPTPLLDFFKRGEVGRDVRLQAAQGILAPRAYEQLAILILLLDDPDQEIRTTADDTLNRIPIDALQTFLARGDLPIDLREFFADRGIFPDEIPELHIDPEEPLLDDGPPDDLLKGVEENDRATALQRLAQMTFPQRLRAASKGTREMRAVLIRDPNKMIAATVMNSPKLAEAEVEGFARMTNVSEDVLRIIGGNRAWMKNYQIVVALAKNPKTPLGISLTLMARLNDRDLGMLSVDRNVPEGLRIAARKKVVAKSSSRG